MSYSSTRQSTTNRPPSQLAVLQTNGLAGTDELCSICGKNLGESHACLYDLPASLLTVQDDRLDTIFGEHYLIEEYAQSGDTCLVYRARHQRSQAMLAAKILPTFMPIDQITLLRGQRATRLAARLDHPNIVRTIDLICQADQQPMLIMEWSEGSPLSRIIAQEAPLEPFRALNIIEQVVNALTYARSSGINHIRLKPSAIMVQQGSCLESAKLLDFGLMKMLSVQKACQVSDSSPYRSPEEKAGRAPDEYSSIYSVGVILYEMLSEKFDDTILNTGEKHGLPALMKVRADMQAAPLIDDLLFKCMSTQPQERFPTLENLAAAVDTLKMQMERLCAAEVVTADYNHAKFDNFVNLLLVLLIVAVISAIFVFWKS